MNKEGILKTIQQYVSKLFNEFDDVSSKINELENNRKLLEDELHETSVKLASMKESFAHTIRQIEVSKAEADVEMRELRQSKEGLEKTITEQTAYVEKLKRELAAMTQEKEAIEMYTKTNEHTKKRADELQKSVDDLTSKRKEEEKVFLANKAEHEKALADIVAEMTERKKELAEIEAQHREETSKVYPKMVELNKREELLNQKERDLKIIEQRWVKIYGEKGKTFKL